MEVTSIGWICGGLLVAGIFFASFANISSGESDVGEGIATGCLGGPGCLVVIIIYILIAQPENPFIVPAIAPPAVTVPVQKNNENDISRPDYLLSPPQNLELDYNSDDGSGRISWDASRWMPTKPSLSNKIEYEIIVKYPDNSMGPYITEEASYRFDYLNAESTGGVRISVKAVGIIRDGSNEFRYIGDVVETSWSPTND